MAAGPKIWRKSPDPTQRSGWGLGTRLVMSHPLMLALTHVSEMELGEHGQSYEAKYTHSGISYKFRL